MPKCTYRERPSDAEMCNTLAEAGKSMCPRHSFMDELRKQKKDAKEANRAEAMQLGVAGAPRSRIALLKAGYLFTGTNECAGCGLRIEWWKTPAQRNAPFNPMPHEDAPAVSHFATCTRANSFRRSA